MTESSTRRVSRGVESLYCAYQYHYWFHLGEAYAIRQLLGHRDLPEFVGDMSGAVYQPER